jgi:hypothetical protein
MKIKFSLSLTTTLLFLLPMVLGFVATDCKHSPTGPGDTTQVDTTSHAFTFQQYSWGGGGGSFFKDVAIISDTNIWAVGEINIIEYDSIGTQIYTPYGAAHWDGTSWKLVKLPISISGIYLKPLGIIAFSSTDIWFAEGTGVYKFDGNKISQSYWICPSALKPDNTLFSSGQIVQKVWGTSDNDLYAITLKGGIAHFDGTSWKKLSSPTTLDIVDIYGATNPKNGNLEILAVATNLANPAIAVQTQLLRIDGTTVSQVGNTLSDWYSSLWFVQGERYYLAGNGVLSRTTLSDTGWVNYSVGTITQSGSISIRGANQKDIFIVGDYFDASHYNGVSWYNYVNEIPHGDGIFGSVSIKGNLMVVGGQTGQNALIVMGRR